VDQVGERSLEELVQNVSQQAVVLAREQRDAARRELTARAKQAGPGLAMVGGGAVLGTLASGTGTAALILVLGRRRGAAAALGVTGAYAGAAAWLTREGLTRLREVVPHVPDAAPAGGPIEKAEQDPGTSKPQTKSAAKRAGTVKSAAKLRPQPGAVRKPGSKTASARRRASGTHTTDRTRRRAT
jgi:hypothetical protein